MTERNLFVWEHVWRSDEYAAPGERARRAVRRARALRMMLPGARLGAVAELGCGDGSFAEVLLRDRAWGVTSYLGIDRSPTAVHRARERLGHLANVQFSEYDVENLGAICAPVDTVIACGVLEHMRDPDKILEQAVGALRNPGGRLILTTSNTLTMMYLARLWRELLHRWPYGYQKNYTPGELRALLDRHFSRVTLRVVQGDWDYPILTFLDRFCAAFNKNVGRYIYAVAQQRGGKASE